MRCLLLRQDPGASYDVNDDDSDPQPRYEYTNENRFLAHLCTCCSLTYVLWYKYFPNGAVSLNFERWKTLILCLGESLNFGDYLSRGCYHIKHINVSTKCSCNSECFAWNAIHSDAHWPPTIYYVCCLSYEELPSEQKFASNFMFCSNQKQVCFPVLQLAFRKLP